MSAATQDAIERFRRDYAAHRAREGRAHTGVELFSLPYLRSGTLARQWSVRARSFEALVDKIVAPMEGGRPLDVLDLGAGNGWLSYRLASRGHCCKAIDLRGDTVDGLGAAAELCARVRFECLVASFEALPLPARSADLAIFNASLHYAASLETALAEAARCLRRGGRIVIVDSPFYARTSDGEAMVLEKRRNSGLAAIDCIEFLTPEALTQASGLVWQRHRVTYPPWYELRPLLAWLRRDRRPSRFDLWTAGVP
jgi:SAM-dependent methyltransferase